MDEIEQLQRAINALDARRALLGKDVVEAALAPMRDRLSALQAERAAERANEQRKLVTVLFSDLAGFTAMSERMDPEDVRDVVDAYFKRWVTCISRYEGEVEKFIGDAVLAVFGLSTAREDDPERAIRSALDMRESLAELNEQLAVERDLQLHMRVGIHTGRVLVSVLDDRREQEFVVVGDPVNLASRLQSNAPVGSIMISHDTYRHVRGVFDVQALPPIQVKGKSEPIAVYLVERAKPRAFRVPTRGVEGVETRMIGRDAELQRLQQAFHEAVQTRQRRLITISGEAGLGKSRLLYEFDNWLELAPQRVRLFKGRADPLMQVRPYGLLRNLFAFRFEIQDNDASAVVRRKLEAGIAEGFSGAPTLLPAEEANRAAHFIGRLVGFDFGASASVDEALENPAVFQERTLQDLEAFCRAQLGRQPVVLLLEDLHWADDSSLDALGWLAQRLSGEPLLVVATARPELFERHPHWGEDQPFHTWLALAPLSSAEGHALVDELLQKVEDLPDSLRQLVVKQAEGNPFYVEELIKMLIEDGIIVKGEDKWRVEAVRLDALRVPATLTGVLQARFDSLAGDEQSALQRAAVVGRVFWDEAVRRLDERQDGADTGALLESLRKREMILRREQSTFGGAREFLFRHALMHDVTYRTLLKRMRRRYHATIAHWLEEIAGQRGRRDEYAALIAEHFERAGDEAAAGWYARAGAHAAAQYANAEALSLLARALALTPEEEASARFEILSTRETVYRRRGEREAQQRDLAQMAALAEALDDQQRMAMVANRQATLADTLADYEVEIAAAQRAIALAQAAGDAQNEAEGLIRWGVALWHQTELPEARRLLQEAAQLAQEAGLRATEAEALRHLGIVAELESDYATAQDYFEQALAICRELGSRFGISKALNSLGVILLLQGKHDEARQRLEQSLVIKREMGDRRGQSATLHNLGSIALALADYPAAARYFKENLTLDQALHDLEGEAMSHQGLSAVTRAVGQHELAQKHAEQALALYRSINDRQGECQTLMELSLLAQQQGDGEEAFEAAGASLMIARERGMKLEEALAEFGCGRALLQLGRAPEAQAALERAVAMLRTLDNRPLLLEAMAGLAQAQRKRGEAAATATVEEIVALLEAGSEQGAVALAVYLTALEALHAASDARSGRLLREAHDTLQARAARLPESWRRSYMEQVPAHRRLLEAWQTRGGGR